MDAPPTATPLPTPVHQPSITSAPTDFAALSPREFAIWHDGYAVGLDHGHRAEEAREERAAAALARRAARLVRVVAALPEVPADKQVPVRWAS